MQGVRLWAQGSGFKVQGSEGQRVIIGDFVENKGKVKGNRLKNIIHRKGAKMAKGLFVGVVQILEERPQYHLPELRGRFRIWTEPNPDG